MIAVVGATGHAGRAVISGLTALSHEPICIVSNLAQVKEVLGARARTVIAELTDPKSLERAFQGVERIFVVTGHNPDMVEQQNNVCPPSPSGQFELIA